MSKKLIKSYNKLLSFLISLLSMGTSFSVTSCNTTAEYGTPYATFKLIGKVTAENDEGIENIRVSALYDTFYTSKNGEYALEINNVPILPEVQMTFSDIDRESNKKYLDTDTLISFEGAVFENGDNSWYQGETSKEINIRLKEDK